MTYHEFVSIVIYQAKVQINRPSDFDLWLRRTFPPLPPLYGGPHMVQEPRRSLPLRGE